MRYLTFATPEPTSYDIAILCQQLQVTEIQRHYVQPYLANQKDRVLAYSLDKQPKMKVADIRIYLGKLLPVLKSLGVKRLVVTDSDYFKTLTKAPTGEGALGYVLPSVEVREAQMEAGAFQVVYCPSFRSIFHNPQKVTADIRTAFNAVLADQAGTYNDPGVDIIKFAAYPGNVRDICAWLDRLLEMDCTLTSDIEAFSLKHYSAGLGTITFCWNKHEGIAFPIDLLELEADRIQVRAALKAFFIELHRRGRTLIWHHAGYDVTVLIYQLFMKDLLDTAGLLYGLEILVDKIEDTKLITYLATNSCAGNKLGLKAQAHEFAGNYAVEGIKDIRQIPLADLLQYNLIDGLGTWFVYEKHHPTMVADQQEALYEGLFKDSLRDIIQMQLTGMPLDMERVKELSAELDAQSDDHVAAIQSSPLVHRLVAAFNREWVEMKNATLKKKRVSLLEAKETFNPNSHEQLRRLLYDADQLALPVIDLSDTKLPSTASETLQKLKNHSQDPDVQALLQEFIDLGALSKIITSFLPAMLAAPMGPDGWHWLFGNFNLGGTISGRLSSSGPNLQNLPANGKTDLKKSLAKAIKSCFKAPPGWLFVGLDFASLEDRISALTTKDPQKLKVYTDGYDGHCLRAYSYFGDQMPDIDPLSVVSINSIESKYKPLRQDSKTPTFLLTYGGTYMGIMDQLGWPELKARTVEAKYHELYKVSDEWVAARIAEAGHCGYVTVAFGLRLRTPLLRQTVLGTSRTPYEAEAEGRSAGNALGQSYGLLNSRASAAFMKKVRASIFRLWIRPSAHIHDAQYHLIRDDLDTLMFYNEHLVEEVKWQNDPVIWHDEVKLGGEVSVFYPSWKAEMTIPNEASEEMIAEIATEHYNKYCAL